VLVRYLKANANAELIDPSHPLSPSTLLPLSQYPVSSTLLSDGRVLVMETFGGGAGPAGSEVFDPRTEKFTPVGPMSTPRTGSIAIRIPDGRVLVFGGVDSDREAVTTVEAFDPDSETFQVIATVPDIQGFSATRLDDGEILIVGGSGNAAWLLKP
jgi:Kelch motif